MWVHIYRCVRGYNLCICVFIQVFSWVYVCIFIQIFMWVYMYIYTDIYVGIFRIFPNFFGSFYHSVLDQTGQPS